MQIHSILKGSLTAAATLSLLVACGPSPTQSGASPTPSAPVGTPTPGSSASPDATPTPDASPDATPTPDGTPAPTATPNPGDSSNPTPSPTATAADDISVVENTTFNGKVFDDDNSPMSGVTVTARSLNSSVPYQATASTSGGTYAFNNAPAGVQIEITASRDGYATRRRVEVLKSNKTGDPNANRYDFGTDGEESNEFGVEYNALSDKPEVIAVTPARNASGIAPDTSFVLEFSESMDTDTVEENFGVYTATDEEFSVGIPVDGVDGDSPTEGLHLRADGFMIGGIMESEDETRASLIWDESAFSVNWNSDDTEVTFTFTDEQQLPTDTESSNVPDYLVTLSGVDDGQIKDESGVTRDTGDGGYFKLTDGNFEMWYEFAIDTDEEEPQVDSVTAVNGGNGDDEIEVEFSEPMLFSTRGGQISGLGDESPLNPANYLISVSNNSSTLVSNVSLANLGGSVRFDSDDETNSTTVLSIPGSDANTVYGPTLSYGDVGDMDPDMTLTLTLANGEQVARTFTASELNDDVDNYPQLVSYISGVNGFDSTNSLDGTLINIVGVDSNGNTAMDQDINYPGDYITFELSDSATYAGQSILGATVTGSFAELFNIVDDASDVAYFASGANGDGNLFAPGNRVLVSVGNSVVDPAGNSIDSSNDEEEDTAN